MSTTVEQSPTTQPRAQQQSASDERRSRGQLTVHRKVVERIAAQAVHEVSAAGGQSGGFLGIGAHADLSTRPKVDVDLTGRTASMTIDVAIAYPASIAGSAEQVRGQAISRVGKLAGVEVTRVDVNITALSRPGRAKEARQ